MPSVNSNIEETYNKQKNTFERLETLIDLRVLMGAFFDNRQLSRQAHETFADSLGISPDAYSNDETETLAEELEKRFFDSYPRNYNAVAELHKHLAIMEARLAVKLGEEINENLNKIPENEPDREKKALYLTQNSKKAAYELQNLQAIRMKMINSFESESSAAPVLVRQEIEKRNKDIMSITVREMAELCGFTEENMDVCKSQLTYNDVNGNPVEPDLDSSFGQLRINAALERKKRTDPNATLTEQERMLALGSSTDDTIGTLFNQGWRLNGRKAGAEMLSENDRELYNTGSKLLNLSEQNAVEEGSEEYLAWIENTGREMADNAGNGNVRKFITDLNGVFAEQKKSEIGKTIKIQEALRPRRIEDQAIDGSIEKLLPTLGNEPIVFSARNLSPFRSLMKSMMVYQAALQFGNFESAAEFKQEVRTKAEEYLLSFRSVPTDTKDRNRFDNVMAVYAAVEGKTGLSKICRTMNERTGAVQGTPGYLNVQTYMDLAKENGRKNANKERILSQIEKTEDPEERKNLCAAYIKTNYKPVLGSTGKIQKYDNLVHEIAESQQFAGKSGRECADWLRQESEYIKILAERADKASEITAFKENINIRKFAGNQAGNNPEEAENRAGDVRPLPNFDEAIRGLEAAELWYGSFEYSKILRDLRTLNNEIKEADARFEQSGVYPGKKLLEKQNEMAARVSSYLTTRKTSIDNRTEEYKNDYLRSHNGNNEGMDEYVADKLKNANARYSAMEAVQHSLYTRLGFDLTSPGISAKDNSDYKKFTRQRNLIKNIGENLKGENPGRNLVEDMKQAEANDREYRVDIYKSSVNPADKYYQKVAFCQSALRSMYLESILKKYKTEAELSEHLRGNFRDEMNGFAKKISASPFGKQFMKKIDELMEHGKSSERAIFAARDEILSPIHNNFQKRGNAAEIEKYTELADSLGSGVRPARSSAPMEEPVINGKQPNKNGPAPGLHP